MRKTQIKSLDNLFENSLFENFKSNQIYESKQNVITTEVVVLFIAFIPLFKPSELQMFLIA